MVAAATLFGLSLSYDSLLGILGCDSWWRSSKKLQPLSPSSAPSGGTVIATVSVGFYPEGLAFDSSNGYVYAVNYDSSTVSVINGATNKDIANVSVMGSPEPVAVAFESTNKNLYVTGIASNAVSVIDGSSNTLGLSAIAGYFVQK